MPHLQITFKKLCKAFTNNIYLKNVNKCSKDTG